MKLILIILSLLGLSLNAISQYSKVFQFSDFNNQGNLPCANLISIGNQFYGTISQGVSGTGNGNGGVFKINKDGTNFQIIKNFANTTQGHRPMGSLYFDGTYLYGTTNTGGGGSTGAFFKILPDGTNFLRTSASSPRGSFVSDGSFLYTATYAGGTSQKGSICKINPTGMTSQIIYSFSGVNGEIPKGDLLLVGNYLYGMTEQGGANGIGTLFRINTDGTGFIKLLDFTGTNGAGGPTGTYIGLGGLITDNTFLYGMTNKGGSNNQGVIFKIELDGTNFQNLLDLNNTITGFSPFGSLYLVNNRLFGMTSAGGTNSFGTIFMIKKDGTNFLKLHDFDGIAGGRTPFGSFYYENGFIYGMTSRTGSTTTTSDEGLIFKKKVCVPTSSSANITSCNQYFWNGQTYNQSGTYTYALNNVSGCDSVATLNLTINNVNSNVNISGNTITSLTNGADYKWLNCNNNMAVINGASSQSYSPKANGNYAVEVTENGCIDTSSCVSITTLSIDEVNLKTDFAAYPNPTNEKINISFDLKQEYISLRLLSLNGQLLSEKTFYQTEKIEFSIFEHTGIYFIELVDNLNNKSTLRVIKQ